MQYFLKDLKNKLNRHGAYGMEFNTEISKLMLNSASRISAIATIDACLYTGGNVRLQIIGNNPGEIWHQQSRNPHVDNFSIEDQTAKVREDKHQIPHQGQVIKIAGSIHSRLRVWDLVTLGWDNRGVWEQILDKSLQHLLLGAQPQWQWTEKVKRSRKLIGISVRHF